MRRETSASAAVENYFAARKKACESLDFVFIPYGASRAGPNDEPYNAAEMEAKGQPDAPNQFDPDSLERLQWVRHLYRKYGWPGKDYRKEEAIKEISGFIRGRTYVAPGYALGS